MPHRNARLRQEDLQVRSHRFYGPHAVMHIVDLATALDLAQNGMLDGITIVLNYVGLHRVAVLGRGFDDADIAQADHGHVQGARDRGRRERKDIDIVPDHFYFLFMLHTETLFFVDNQ